MRSAMAWILSRFRLARAIRAFFGPLDKGTNVCNDDICDVGAQAVESASSKGVLVVAAAGSRGDQAEGRRSLYGEFAQGRRRARLPWALRRTVIWCIRPCE